MEAKFCRGKRRSGLGLRLALTTRKKSDEGGFTLVEVLVAMVVLSTGILALTLMMKQSVGSTDYGRKVTTAENLAIEMMERIKYGAYDDIPQAGVNPSGGSPHTFTTVVQDYGTIPNYPEFRREINCEVLRGWSVDFTHGFLKKLTITVRWRSVGSIGQGGSVTLVTFVSR